MRPDFVFKLYKLTHNAEPVVRLLVLPPVKGRWPISREALYVSTVFNGTVSVTLGYGGLGAGGDLLIRRGAVERRGS